MSDKKNVERCKYEVDQREYCYLGEGKMYKCMKEQLGVKFELV